MHNSVNKKPMDETVGLDSMLQKVWRCIEDKSLRVIDSTEDIAFKIYCRLVKRKFLLLLDDIWERLDLNLVGIPLPNDKNESKVIFTTRSEDVCGLMGAQQNIKIECLTQEEALRLFRMKVGENTLNSNPRIPKLAKVMAAECKGLPLALVTVGHAMATRKDPEDWESEIATLRNTPSEFPGMDSVLLPLKKEELIEYWRQERFLDKYDRDREYIIKSLKHVCLLESAESEELIRMHGLVRDMAWWECKDKVAIFIKRDAESDEERGLRIWNGVERLSLWDYSIDDVLINSSPSCIEQFCENVTELPNLRTMICKVPMLTTFPAGFFPSMSALALLDLSNSFLLRELPPEIGKLINLEYLNVSQSAIITLPIDLGQLEKLRWLFKVVTPCQMLGCTDATPDLAYLRPTRQDAATREGRRRLRVHAASCHVDFLTRADAAQIGADSR
ncbi:disease resistance protein SUMM2-like [Quercus robur]|uniref:disease resistance protein SUMM2-like n=1 Tax=Quercus robur TaxID=38942 RepID=UPI00216180F3|nr:disease resistance protein SUMM2-like [Quercus robur]